MPAPKGHAPYPGCEKGGRPKRYIEPYVNQLAELLEHWLDLDKENIFIEDWCLENDIPEDTVAQELIKNDKFSRAYKKLKTKQKAALFKGGLKRKFAHPMCALILSHSHGIYQKTEQKVTSIESDPIEWIVGNIDGNSKDLVHE